MAINEDVLDKVFKYTDTREEAMTEDGRIKFSFIENEYWNIVNNNNSGEMFDLVCHDNNWNLGDDDIAWDD